LVRLILLVECVSTFVGALLAFAAPEREVRMIAPVHLDRVARAVVMQVGASWVVLALLIVILLRLGPDDRRPLRMIIGAILVGDVLHVLAVAALADAAGTISGSGIGQLVFLAVLVANRVAAWLDPRLVLPGSSAQEANASARAGS
jgi:hypothetical protein